MNPDEIEIRRLEVECHIGVPDEERAAPQKLCVTVKMQPSQGFLGLQDKVQNTVDYYEVSLKIAELAAQKPRHLIETLATDLAEALLTSYPLKAVNVKIEKRILASAEYVAVKIHRSIT
jgi:7,8-dihydroneopterin aldolase/epimerase/oxygenase